MRLSKIGQCARKLAYHIAGEATVRLIREQGRSCCPADVAEPDESAEEIVSATAGRGESMLGALTEDEVEQIYAEAWEECDCYDCD